jgi:hypothetical protein
MVSSPNFRRYSFWTIDSIVNVTTKYVADTSAARNNSDWQTDINCVSIKNACSVVDGNNAVADLYTINLALTNQQCIVTHTIRQNDVPVLLASWVKKHLLSKCRAHKRKMFVLVFCKNVTCLNVGLLIIGQVFFSVHCKIVHRWIATDCCFMSDMLVNFLSLTTFLLFQCSWLLSL